MCRNFNAKFLSAIFFCLALGVHQSCGEKILFFLPLSSYSHRIPMWPLATYLAEHGHEVTFVSPYSPKNPHPNITEIVPKEFNEIFANLELGSMVEPRRKGQTDASWSPLAEMGIQLCEVYLKSPDTQEWVKKSKFDLVIIDGLFNDCALGLVHIFKAKFITYATSAPCMWQIDGFGLVPESNWIPDMQYYFPQRMNIVERFRTAYNTLRWHWLREYDYLPKLEQVIRTNLNVTDLPPLREIERNVSLVLLNSHYSEEFARSLPPHVIPVGGMHIQDSRKPLPKVLNDFVTSGDKGFVYISFGSTVDLSREPPEVFAAIMGAIKKLDLNVLWKCDMVPTDTPSNLLIQKWIPQQDILAHPNIKAFVTHSGLMSITEAIYHGVPLVSLPVGAEQDYNAERVHTRGYGVRLEIATLTENELFDAISTVVNDPVYKARMLLKSKQYKDRPMKPLESAIWWTEFVLRHEDTSFLKPTSIYQSWWMRRSLDVYGLVFAAVTILLILAWKTLQICGSLLGARSSGSRVNNLSKDKKQQ